MVNVGGGGGGGVGRGGEKDAGCLCRAAGVGEYGGIEAGRDERAGSRWRGRVGYAGGGGGIGAR